MGRLEEGLSHQDDGGQAYRRFQETHRSLADRVERFLVRLVILGLVALTLVQTLQVVPFVRRQINVVEALEGISYQEFLAWMPARSSSTVEIPGEPAIPVSGTAQPFSLTVVLTSQQSAPAARLLVDGREVGTFETAVLTVAVAPGQQVEVDGTQVPEELTFRVVGASGLASPVLGASVVTQGSRKSLGAVQAAERAR